MKKMKSHLEHFAIEKQCYGFVLDDNQRKIDQTSKFE